TLISSGTLVANDVNALGTGDVTDNATLMLNTGGDFTNNIGGTGRVEKSGDDALTLSGSNTYTGGTLISSGTLVASNVEALGTGDVTDNATLELNTSGTFDNAISGSGQVVKSGDKMLTLSGASHQRQRPGGKIRRRHAHAFRQQYLYRRHPYQQRHAGRQQR
ncbi:autotransporter-associated beta strand repeat-containing protein, partial [Salmonella enterica]|uniref:autotransporter-associated beta strand repeat-containing protein n=1 Tax=Salmonella enterica TaxID=28901 RepID=UPI0004F15BC2